MATQPSGADREHAISQDRLEVGQIDDLSYPVLALAED